MIRSPARFSLIATIVTLAWIAASPAGGDPGAPDRTLTNEDIVRLVMTGTTEQVILQEIADRQVEFKLAPEIVEELRIAGVNGRIIEAMRLRDRELHAGRQRGESPPGAGAEAGPTGFVTLEINAGQDDRQRSKSDPFAIRVLPDGVKPLPGVEVGRVSDLALAVLCSTPDHVPDHWDIHSPIEGAPRHGVLLFHPGSRPDRIKKFDILRLTTGALSPVTVRAGRHALIVALAGRSAGSGAWQLLASDPVDVEIEAGGSTAIALEAASSLRGNRMVGYTVEHEWKVVSGAGE